MQLRSRTLSATVMSPSRSSARRVFHDSDRSRPSAAPSFRRSPVRVASLAAAGALIAALGGCSGGTVGEPGGQGVAGGGSPGDPLVPGAAGSVAPGGPPGSTAGTGAAGSNSGTNDPTSGAPLACQDGRVEPRAVLVPPRQYVNLLRDLVGATAVSEADAAASSELLVETIDRPRMTTATLDRYVRLAEGAAESLRGKTATFLNCQNLMDAACVRGAIERIGTRAYKRPLASDELDGLMQLRDAGVQAVTTDGGETGALTALQALLIAPSTMYRTEFLAGGQGSARKLTPHERAAALGAFLLDSVPDAELLAAADDGSLATPAGVQAQVDRLLALPRVRTHLTQVVLTAFNVPRIFNTPKDAAVFPNYTMALQSAMYEETRRFVDDILWTRKAPIAELMTSRKSFVNGELAKLYGLPAPRNPMEFTPVELPPERAGLLTQPSVMSVLSRTDNTSVVARGLYVRGNMLCLPKIPGPPLDVQAQVAEQLDAKSSQKELAAYRAMTSPCLGCHAQFDRFGLLLEPFDAVGKYLPAQSEPVDFKGLGPFTSTVNDVSGLVALMARDQMFEECFTDRTLSFALTIATDSAELCLRGADGGVQPEATMRDLVLAVAQSATFNDRTEVGP